MGGKGGGFVAGAVAPAAGLGVSTGEAGETGARKSCCVLAGGGLATEESMTTILPAPATRMGSRCVGFFKLPVRPVPFNGGVWRGAGFGAGGGV